jgi:hypothetical protein
MDLDERLRDGLREAGGKARFDGERWARSVARRPAGLRFSRSPGPRPVRRWVAGAAMATVLLAGIALPLALLSDLGGGGTRPGGEPDRTVISGSGLHLRIPEDWDGRALGPQGTMFGPVLQASNRPLLGPEDDDLTTATRKALEPGQVALVLIDYTETRARLGHQAGDDDEFPVEDLPISIRAADFQPSFEGVDSSHDFARRTFGVNGRSFDLWVEFGEKPAPEALVAQVNEILATLQVDPLDAPTGLRTHTNADDGLSITIPAAWTFHEDPSGPADPRTVFGVGTWTFPRGGDCAPTAAQEALPPDGGFLWLIEYQNGSDAAEFPARPEHFDLDQDTLGHYECSLVPSYLIRFQDAGRYFQVHVAFGPEASDSLGPEFLRALESLEVTAPVPEGCPSETGPWADPDCPLSAWTRAVIEEAGYRVTGDTGSALEAVASGGEFHVWAFPPEFTIDELKAEENYRQLAIIDDTVLYSDGIRAFWMVQGLAVWVSGWQVEDSTPPLAALGDLVRSSQLVDYDAIDTRSPI